eukprot:19286-Heterococcus_DN1.PRE.4
MAAVAVSSSVVVYYLYKRHETDRPEMHQNLKAYAQVSSIAPSDSEHSNYHYYCQGLCLTLYTTALTACCCAQHTQRSICAVSYATEQTLVLCFTPADALRQPLLCVW